MAYESYVYCNQCGHRNPPESNFCSSCGAALDLDRDERTITYHPLDPQQDAAGPSDDIVVNLAELPPGGGVLLVRSNPEAGKRLVLEEHLTQLGRHPDSDIFLDDITVSRRHAEIERVAGGYLVRDVGSLNGTYVNQTRTEGDATLVHGDELQIGKFKLVFLIGPEEEAG